MVIKFKNCVATDNGLDGYRIDARANVELEGSIASGNKGSGFNVSYSDWMVENGLPAETDPEELARLLSDLIRVEVPKQEEIVKSSSFFQKISKLTFDGSTLAANILTIASNPMVADVIRFLQP